MLLAAESGRGLLALRPGEWITHKGQVALLPLPWLGFVTGKLYLTDQRLVWIREPLNLPLPSAPSFELELRDIKWAGPIRASWMGAYGTTYFALEGASNVWLMYGLEGPAPLLFPSPSAAREWSAAIGAATRREVGAPSSDSASLRITRESLHRLGLVLAAILGFLGLFQFVFNYLVAGLFFALLFTPADVALLIGAFASWRHFKGLAWALTPKLKP